MRPATFRSRTDRPIVAWTLGAALAAAGSLAAPAAADDTRELLALTYPEGETISVVFDGTPRLPRASGEAKVERKRGSTEIEIELDEMKPATAFGGDFATYVLWVASPEGHVDNTGEFILEGNRSKLDVSTPLESFGMFVTAEPHFLVKQPSRFVVLENVRPTESRFLVDTSRVHYDSSATRYSFVRGSLEDVPEAKGEVRPHLASARSAIQIAERAGADRYAASELDRARRALERAERSASTGAEGQLVMLHAHESIRAAVAAEERSRQAAYQARLAEERSENAARIQALRQSLEEAGTEAERARVVARQKELEARMQADAREAAWREAERAREQAALADQRRLQAEAQRSAARDAAARARRDTAEARLRMQQALAEVTAVRDTARGLVVSVPDVLFEFDRAELRSDGREKLAKIAGILLVSPGLDIAVEGHTDSTGSLDYNLGLSHRRAASVRDYLVSQGLDAETITAAGFGEQRPVASNATEAGRRRNRRVEIVLEEPAPERASSGGADRRASSRH